MDLRVDPLQGRHPYLVQPACIRQAPELPRMTRDQLEACTKKELAEVARKKGVTGWHAMTKPELIAALAPKPPARKPAPRKPAARTPAKKTPARNRAALRAPVQRSVARDT